MKKPKIDYILLLAILALSAVGLIMVFSASPTLAMKHGDTLYYLKRQILYLGIGLLALFYGLSLDLDYLKSKTPALFVVSLLLLIFVFIPGVGRSVLGASRWIDLGVIAFQPSEFIKLTSVIFLAKWLADNRSNLPDLIRGFLPPLAVFGLISALIIKQPDMGTALIIGAMVFAMLFLAGADYKHLAGVSVIGISGIVLLSVTSAYRFRRLLAFIDPWKDPQGIGFHIIQSLLAVGSGGFFGVGLGASRQKFFYLPQQFTDFIFAILCEELGFIGGTAVAALFVILAWRGLTIAAKSKDPFKSLLAGGITAWITFQALMNIMVVLGLIPTTGIPLPFISYGGTALIINLFASGLILNVSART